MNQTHLAVDIGAASGRVFVGAVDGGALWSRELHRFVTGDLFFRNRRVRNFYRYYEEILHGMRAYAEEYGSELASIGVDGFGSDFILLDRNGDPATLTPSYRQDSQTPMADEIERIYGGLNLYRRNGNHSMSSDTLQQLLRMQRADDPALRDPGAILFFADIFHYLLGAPACCEHSLASYSRFYNADADAWDDEVMRKFALPAGLKTRVVRCGERIGELHRELALDTGLAPGVAIITPCTHDTACAALAVPDDNDDWLFISSGSWSLLGTETPGPVYDERAWRANLSNSSMPFAANMFKKNINGMWFMQECRRAWRRYSFEEMVDRAEAATAVDWYIDANSRKFFAPPNMPEAVGADIGERYGVRIDSGDVGQVTLICLQSIAMKYRYYVDLMREVTGKRFTKIYILGGGSKNRLLNRLTADITGLPVHTGVHEASVTGNLLLQAYGSGQLSSRGEIRRVVKNTFPITVVEPADVDAWDKRYARYLADMPAESAQ